MEVIADMQVHSKYARATSKDLSIENLEKWGKIKGLNLIGTGDFQHPLHRKEIDEKLKEDDKGILRLKSNSNSSVAFLWQTEISLIFSQGGKKRAIHLLIFAPNRKIADEITKYLGSKGRLDYDGRPIFGMSCEQAVKELKEIDDMIEIIPAHSFTPYFGIFGSKSGFDSLEGCFLSQTGKIYAIESGMSADPGMAWRLKEKVNIVSFSDAHSFWPWRIGREATIFELPELSYVHVVRAIRTGEGLKATIETPPAYGKYHWDGHKDCNFSCSFEETKKLGEVCPVCKRLLTIGVENRIEELAKEKSGYKSETARDYYSLVPLHELIAFSLNSTLNSKKTWSIYNIIIEKFGNELDVLLKTRKEELLEGNIDKKLVDLILSNRSGNLPIKPGYDGVYGVIDYKPQKNLSEFF